MGDDAAALAAWSTAWGDRWWDDERALVWNPDGGQPGIPGRHVHLVPQSAWYALGLLQRDRPGDRARAARGLEAICALQYDDPDTPWHGTFARFAETPHPGPDAVMWEDYDPNWRQFLATAFGLVLERRDRLPEGLAARLEDAVDAAVRAEPAERVPPWYTNIALKRAFLEVEYGIRHRDDEWRARGEAYARSIVERHDRHGAFDEFNSPTYDGVDLYALGLWRSRSSSPQLQEWGARLEESRWRSIARWYHAGLRNVAGPFTRAYGMDMTRYVAKLGLWIAAAVGRELAPLPDPDDPDAHHTHDWCFAPCIAALGARVPPDVVDDLVAFTGERTVTQTLPGGREATAWLGERVMIGAESSDADWGGWDQFHAATVHWRRPDGRIGWLRAMATGTLDARASPGALLGTVGAPTAGGPPALELVADPACPPDAFASSPSDAGSFDTGSEHRWNLPGLTVTLDTDARVRASSDPHRPGVALVPANPDSTRPLRCTLHVEPA